MAGMSDADRVARAQWLRDRRYSDEAVTVARETGTTLDAAAAVLNREMKAERRVSQQPTQRKPAKVPFQPMCRVCGLVVARGRTNAALTHDDETGARCKGKGRKVIMLRRSATKSPREQMEREMRKGRLQTQWPVSGGLPGSGRR